MFDKVIEYTIPLWIAFVNFMDGVLGKCRIAKKYKNKQKIHWLNQENIQVKIHNTKKNIANRGVCV